MFLSIKRRFSEILGFVLSVMQDVASKSERGRKIEQAVSQTRKAVGKMLSSMNSEKR